MRSTANHIGILEINGKLTNRGVLFSSDSQTTSSTPQTAEVEWYAPMPLGSRQLPLERWVATPMYRIKLLGTAGLQAIQKPVKIVLERELPEELLDYESRNFSAENVIGLDDPDGTIMRRGHGTATRGTREVSASNFLRVLGGRTTRPRRSRRRGLSAPQTPRKALGRGRWSGADYLGHPRHQVLP